MTDIYLFVVFEYSFRENISAVHVNKKLTAKCWQEIDNNN